MHPVALRIAASRRTAFLASLLLTYSPALLAQGADAFPTRPVTLVMAVAAGGPTDVETRLYAKKMTELMGQPFVLDFKPGAGGAIGTALVAKAPPDGHTLLLMSGNFTVMPAVYRNLPFDTLRDFAPVSLVSETYMILITPPGFPAQGFPQYLAHARANPGKVNVGATGQAGVNHLMNVWLHSLAGVQVTHVPYKGAALLFPDLLAGRIDAATIVVGAASRMAREGKVRALGSTGTTRSKLMPELPTLAEQGLSQFRHTSWVGFGAPAATPAAIVNKLSEQFALTACAPEVRGPLEPEGYVLVGSTPAQFRQLLAAETERWKRVVQESGISVSE